MLTMILAQSEDGEGPFHYTEAEAAEIAKLAEIRVKADGGDRRAKAQIAKLQGQLNVLKRRARTGDARAARKAKALEESGLLTTSQTFAMDS